ncbi:MAG: MlaD family protein [Bdellovibrionia bacterium]
MRERSEVKAGAVIVCSIILLLVVVISAGRFSQMFKKKQILHVLFTDVQGLKVDDPVQVMGLEQGKVQAMRVYQYKDEVGLVSPMVEITAEVAYAEPFPKDSKITIDRSLTGNTALKIEPGRDSEKFALDQKIMGLGAVSVTELANKAGVMTKRLDDFLADLTDKNISGAVRSLVINLKQISDQAKSISSSLAQSIPGTEKNLMTTFKNVERISHTLDQLVLSNKDKLAGMIQNLNSSTESLAATTLGVEKVIAKSEDKIHSTIANVEKATSNIKTLTREVRWQPWVLLNKPDEVEIKERSVYNSALEFSEGAESLNNTVKQLLVLVNSRDQTVDGQERYKKLVEQIHENLEKSATLERKLWSNLTDKSSGKSH